MGQGLESIILILSHFLKWNIVWGERGRKLYHFWLLDRELMIKKGIGALDMEWSQKIEEVNYQNLLQMFLALELMIWIKRLVLINGEQSSAKTSEEKLKTPNESPQAQAHTTPNNSSAKKHLKSQWSLEEQMVAPIWLHQDPAPTQPSSMQSSRSKKVSHLDMRSSDLTMQRKASFHHRINTVRTSDRLKRTRRWFRLGMIRGRKMWVFWRWTLALERMIRLRSRERGFI